MTRTKIDCSYAGDTGLGYFSVVAETSYGRRFLHLHNFQSLEKAERTVARVINSGSIDEQHWAELEPIYGTDASADEQFEASVYAEGLRNGVIGEADVPDCLRALL